MATADRAPLIVACAVGLTSRLLDDAPRLRGLALQGWQRRLREVVPAVTSTAQASILTGVPPQRHGIVANGWLYRDTMEIRFWQQSNRLIQAPTLYHAARRIAREQGRPFRCAKLFWWFNQGADVDISVTPKPYYGADGNKRFGITGTPDGLTDRLEKKLGTFPFHTFWGPSAGLPATEWIARCAQEICVRERPDLTLVYLPHLDYDPQRYGPAGCDLARTTGELDSACAPLFDAAERIGARLWFVSEYGHCQVSAPVHPNRLLRQAGLLRARPGPFGESLDTFTSRAFAVCDHQVCHVYVADTDDIERVRDVLSADPGIERIYAGPERAEIGLEHPRAGELVLLASPDRWFAYPYWHDDRVAPDFARTVDIHRKPGFDPCELFFDPKLWWPKGKVLCRLLEKTLGMRTLFDVVPLDPLLVHGSHGLCATDPLDQPILIGDGRAPVAPELPMTDVFGLVLRAVTES